MQELFETRNGRVIMDEDLSSKMYLIKQYHPEKADETSSGFEWSEMGMANLFGLLYSHEARYCPEHKSWYTYHEGAWRKDEGAILISEKIKDFVRLMILYCGEIEDDDTRKSYTGFVNKMGDRRMRDRILKDATGELRISAVQFDADPYLINCLNGTYETSPSESITGKIFSPCRPLSTTPFPRRLSVNAGKSSLKRSHRMTRTRQTSFKELWVIPCWV